MKHKHWQPGTLMAQAYRDIANEHNATVDALEAALAPIRVPFSDDVIERMAEAACDAAGVTYEWIDTPLKTNWRSAIRAALAAGGLDYAPEDVAFSGRVHELESKIENQRMNLRQLHEARERDALERARLESEIARLEHEITIERDKANRFDAIAQGLSDIVDGQKRDKDSLQNSLARVTSERDTLRAELDAVTSERDEARQEQDNLIFQRNDFRHWHMNEQKKVADLTAELAALRQPVDATPTDAQVEALARVLQRAYMKECYVDANECTPNAGYLAEARAAYAHIGRVPVGVECKECIQWRNANNELVRRVDAARAALEGE